jgi:hypothetical protein
MKEVLKLCIPASRQDDQDAVGRKDWKWFCEKNTRLFQPMMKKEKVHGTGITYR